MALPLSAYLREDVWNIAGAGVQVGQASASDTQVVAGPTPWWVCNLTYRVPRTAHFEWEAFMDTLRGQVNPINVVPTQDRMIGGGVGQWDGGVCWDDSILWDTDLADAIYPLATSSQFARSIVVNDPDWFAVGRFFFVGQHGYRVNAITGNTINFAPGLRAPLDVLNEIKPTGTFKMILADRQIPEFPRGTQGFSDLTLRFMERLT